MTQDQVPPFNRAIVVAVLVAGAFVSVLNQTLMIVAIPPIMNTLGVTANQAQWVTTAFMLASGVLIPVSAALIDRFSSRRLYLVALVVFLTGTLVGATATSFWQLLLARVIQGGSAGIVMPLIQTTMMSLFPPEKRGSAMGLVGLVIAFAPAIGPTLAGWLVDQFSWRSLFIVLIPIASLVLVAAWFVMRDITPRKNSNLDPLSIALSSFGWGGLLYGFSLVGSAGWSDASVLVALAIGALSLWLFIRHQLRMPEPLLEFRVFKAPVFRRSTILSIVVFSVMIGAQTLIPLYIQNVREFSALQTGLVLLPGAVVMGIMSPLAGRLFDTFGIRWLALFGFSAMTTAMLIYTRVGMDTSLGWLVFGFSLQMLGVSSCMMPLITAGINSLQHHEISHGTAVNNTLRMVGASLATAMLLTVMAAGARLSGAPETPEGQLAGIHLAFIVAAAVAAAGLLATGRLSLRRRTY